MLPKYVKNEDGRLWWCNSHGRKATHLLLREGMSPKPTCAPGLSGIMLPCFAVDLTEEVELVEPSGHGG